MVSQPGSRRRKSRGPMPPGPRIALVLLFSGLLFASAFWLLQPRPNGAQQLVVQSGAAAATMQSISEDVPSMAPLNKSAEGLPVAPFKMTEEMVQLTQHLKEQCNKPNLHAGVFVVDPDTGRFLDLDARRPYSAASMIKLPILVALAQALDAKQTSLDQQLTIRQDLIGGGSGWLQWRKPGTRMSVKDTAELMIIISDNTATNMIVDLLGGATKVNESFSRYGLSTTRINNPLPDLAGTNTTSPYDLVCLMSKIDNGDLVSPQQRAWIIDTLMRNKIRTLLPMGVPPGTKVADKTGDIATLVGDVGIITATSGKRYIAAAFVERPWNDRRANALIRQISKDVYAGVTGDTNGIKSLEAAASSGQLATRHHGSRRHHHRRSRRH